ncbi:MAG: carbohydrate ABC transporter permease [Anaerocolumna sp.]
MNSIGITKKKKNITSIKRNAGDQVAQIFIYFIITAFSLATILPFLYIIAGSLATERELTERAFFIIPKEISVNAYRYIGKAGDIFKGLKNSILVTVVGTFLDMAFTTTFAYPLSRSDFKRRNGILNMVIVTMVFSGGMIPSYLLVSNLGLIGSYGALILPGVISAFNMIIVKNYFQGIPKELEEAAKMDGCTDLGIFAKIILPLSKPVLASVSLFYAVGHWNEYFNAMLYISSPEKEVVQIVLRRIVLLANGIDANGQAIDYGMLGAPPEKAVKMAATVVATIPILIVYPFIQKFFTQGVMIGAVKG